MQFRNYAPRDAPPFPCLKFFSVFSSQPQAGILADLEIEGYLQVNAPISRRRRVRPACKAVGLAEERRTQIADGSGEIDVIEDVSRRDAKCQIVAAVRSAAIHTPAAAKTPTTTRASVARASGAASKCAASTGPTGTRVGRFRLFAEAESLAQTKIQSEAPSAFGKVDRNNRLARLGSQIKATVRSSYDAGSAGRAGTECRARIEEGILVEVLPGGDIERNAGLRDEERADSKPIRQAYRAAKKKTMANVERGAAVILAHVEWIRGETPRAGSIAIGVAESVIAEKRKLRSHSNAGIHNELVLLEDAFGLILENILVRAVGPQAGDWIGRIQIGGEKLVDPARGQISRRQVCEFRKLAFQTDAGLDGIGSAKIGIGLIASRIALGQCGRRWRVEEIKLRAGDEELLLRGAVEALLPQEEVIRKAVIKHARPNAEHGLWRILGISADAPSETEARGKIGVVAKIILGFESKTVTESDVRAKPPIVLNVQPGIEISDLGQGAAGSDGIETGAASVSDSALQICLRFSSGQVLKGDEVGIQPGNLRASRGRIWYAAAGNSRIGARTKTKRAVEVGHGLIDIPGSAEPHAKFKEVFSMRHRSVILQFVSSKGVVIDSSAVSAAIEATLDGNQWGRALRGLVTGFANELKAGLINDFGVHDLCVADLELVLGIQLVKTQRL